MDSKIIADGLKRRRAELKLSIADVVFRMAEAGINVSPKTIYGWENNVSQPKVSAFLKLCDIYKIDDIIGYFQ